MSKKIKILVSVLVALILVLGIAILVAVLSLSKSRAISAVFLDSGQIYIGRLSAFPKLVLIDPYLLQVVSDPNDPKKTTFQLMPLKDNLWSPEKIYLNREHIIFTSPVGDNSQVGQALKSK